jgi:hypothetical protein
MPLKLRRRYEAAHPSLRRCDLCAGCVARLVHEAMSLSLQHIFLWCSYITGLYGAYSLLSQVCSDMRGVELTPGALRTIAWLFLALLFFCWSVPA